jgi:hypothetical protein
MKFLDQVRKYQLLKRVYLIQSYVPEHSFVEFAEDPQACS